MPQPLPSDDTRVENMDISDEGEGLARGWEGAGTGALGWRRWSEQASPVFPPEEGGAPQPGSPQVLEEDEAELELQKQLEKGRRLRQLQQLQQLRDSGEKVRLGMGRPGPTSASAVTCPHEHVCHRQQPHYCLKPLFHLFFVFWVLFFF